MPGASLDDFRARLRGELIQPSDAGYEAARKVHNAMIDRRPALIVKCADVADVMACVNYGGEAGLRVSIRCGGHNAAGLGVCDDGLVIDLSRMRGVRVDPAARTVRVDGGCVWGDVDHATHAFGMATPSGVISTTGVGGLTLGGGLGHLTRKCGLAIDNLLSVDMVLADGRFVTASADENPDLFWAVRGGGGNFGVVTSFLFRLHPVKMVYAGPTVWPLEKAADALKVYREFIVAAPEDINGFFTFFQIPPVPLFPESLHFKTMSGVVWCCTCSPEEADRALRPMRGFGPPAFDWLGLMPHPMLQSFFDPLYPPGLQYYWKADFFREVSDEAVARHVEHGSLTPTLQSLMHLYPIDGAAHRVGRNDTAFSFRDAHWAEVILGVGTDPADNEKIVSWTRNYWEALHPYSSGGAYVNFMMDEGEDRIKATYRENYDRLAAVKKKYDPANFFRVNQNIRPAA